MDKTGAPPDRRVLIDTLRDYIAQIREEGMDGLPIFETAAPTAPSDIARQPLKPTPNAQTSSSSVELLSRYPGLEKTQSLEELSAFIGECSRCKLCKLGRTKIVFGVGDPEADLMFVGEGPGAD